MLYLGDKINLLTQNDFDRLMSLVLEVSKMIGGLMTYLKSLDK